jgi:hypothetical protein
MKCPNCNQPQANDEWCTDCLKKPVTRTIQSLVKDGLLYDTGKRRGGRTVWAITDAGKALALREDGQLN